MRAYPCSCCRSCRRFYSLLWCRQAWPPQRRVLAGVALLVLAVHGLLLNHPAWTLAELGLPGRPDAPMPLITITRVEQRSASQAATQALPTAPTTQQQTTTSSTSSARSADDDALASDSATPGDYIGISSDRAASAQMRKNQERLAKQADPAPPTPPQSIFQEPVPAAEEPPVQRGPLIRAASDMPSVPTNLPPPPVYPVQLPANLALNFVVERGLAVGKGRLEWQTEDNNYLITQTSQAPGRPDITWVSRGLLDANGLAPLRMIERYNDRDRNAVNFQRDKSIISYSDVSLTAPLPPGAQDRASWLIQLASIAQARKGEFKAGEAITLQVASPRGQLDTWLFRVQPPSHIQLPGGREISALYLLREPTRPYDIRVDVWLVAQWHYLPLRMRWLMQPDGEPIEWWLDLDSAPAEVPSRAASAPSAAHQGR